jgi:anaerobic selenocysteine-containing dehydrogenase
MKVRATCPLDCPDACSLLLTVSPETNQLLKVEGDPNHPVSQGFACVKTYRYPERNHHPKRPLYPMRRVGPKGSGEWERVSWQEALDDIYTKLSVVIDLYGGEAVLPYHYGGTMGLHQGDHPLAFFRAIGAAELDTTICATAGSEAWVANYGAPRYGVDPEDVPNAKFILLWGINSLATNSHLTPFLKQARQGGARIVHIDPYESQTSKFADQHVKVRPGSDSVLAYAMARVIIHAGLHDQNFISRLTQGFEGFKAEAEKWNLELAEEITRVPAKTIEELALEFAKAKASFIRTSYGLTRHPGGANALRAITLLPALTGAWQYQGGGALLSTSGAFGLNRRFLGGQHLIKEPQTAKHYFQPDPGVRHINMTEFGSALTRLDPPVRALFVYNSNPAVIAPDSSRVREGLRRDNLFTVVLEQAMTETAQLADYVLPATTFVEHPDLYTAYGHHYISWNEPALGPQGEAQPNTWVFAQLAQRMELEEPTLYWSAEELAHSLLDTEHPWLQSITLDLLKAEGYTRLKSPRPFMPFKDKANTPSGRVMFEPAPKVILTEPTSDYPLVLMTPPAKHFLNSTYGHIERLVAGEGGEPLLIIHPLDAGLRSIRNGKYVRIRSRQGEVIRKANVSSAPIPGTVVLEGTWWEGWAVDKKGSNHLTSERLTDMGAGSTFHSNPVEVEPMPLDWAPPNQTT